MILQILISAGMLITLCDGQTLQVPGDDNASPNSKLGRKIEVAPGEDDQNPTPESKTDVEKFHAGIVLKDKETDRYYLWAGVILNNRFVLSVDPFRGKKDNAKDLQIAVGYKHVGQLNQTKGMMTFRNCHCQDETRFFFENNTAVYKVDQILIFKYLLLFETKRIIEFGAKVDKIDFPGEKDLEIWANPFTIPNGESFSTSYWCREKNSEEYQQTIIKEIRNCTRSSCYRPGGVVFPSCLQTKIIDKHCWLAYGSAIVYKNMLMGLRIRSKFVKPSTEISEDDFINVATIVEHMDHVMSQRCVEPKPFEPPTTTTRRPATIPEESWNDTDPIFTPFLRTSRP